MANNVRSHAPLLAVGLDDSAEAEDTSLTATPKGTTIKKAPNLIDMNKPRAVLAHRRSHPVRPAHWGPKENSAHPSAKGDPVKRVNRAQSVSLGALFLLQMKGDLPSGTSEPATLVSRPRRLSSSVQPKQPNTIASKPSSSPNTKTELTVPRKHFVQQPTSDRAVETKIIIVDEEIYMKKNEFASEESLSELSSFDFQDKEDRLMLILDIDETLVHCSTDPITDPDLAFLLEWCGSVYTVYVKKRPHLDYFLQEVSRWFELAVFTASQQVYADSILELVDPERSYFPKRYYRESCTFVDNYYFKDLSHISDLSRVCLIDNTPQVFSANPSNGIPILSWYDDPNDTALLDLLPFLHTLCLSNDVRPIIQANYEILMRPIYAADSEQEDDDYDTDQMGATCEQPDSFMCTKSRKTHGDDCELESEGDSQGSDGDSTTDTDTKYSQLTNEINVCDQSCLD